MLKSRSGITFFLWKHNFRHYHSYIFISISWMFSTNKSINMARGWTTRTEINRTELHFFSISFEIIFRMTFSRTGMIIINLQKALNSWIELDSLIASETFHWNGQQRYRNKWQPRQAYNLPSAGSSSSFTILMSQN